MVSTSEPRRRRLQTPLDWNSAKPGGEFIKIGVGVLRKTDETYNRFFPYEIVDTGKWTVKTHQDLFEFQQVLSDPALGFVAPGFGKLAVAFATWLNLERHTDHVIRPRRLMVNCREVMGVDLERCRKSNTVILVEKELACYLAARF